jgi:hypothetical protein
VTPTVTVTPTITITPTITVTPTPTITVTPSPTKASSADSFPFPRNLIVSNSQSYYAGYYTRKKAGDKIALGIFGSTGGLTVSGSDYVYTRTVFSAGPSDVMCIIGPNNTLRDGDTSSIAYQVADPHNWAFLQFGGYDVYGNKIIDEILVTLSASDGGVPRYWNVDSRYFPALQSNYIISPLAICLSAEALSNYLPLTTNALTSYGVNWLIGNPGDLNDYTGIMNTCQPLTAAGNLTWNGRRPYQVSGGTNWTVTFAYINDILLPYWKMSAKWSGSANIQIMALNFCTSAFGIPLSGWSYDNYKIINRDTLAGGYLRLSGSG